MLDFARGGKDGMNELQPPPDRVPTLAMISLLSSEAHARARAGGVMSCTVATKFRNVCIHKRSIRNTEVS